ncbi:MAG: bifunctional adenosylcobinamide kinase/adenosylcobinamide-phosphate guanylyltransferase [Methylococcaceae bacterium]|nr:bifunctional adenosylcobinamide kinase/adenosylcobinamide-phosphate guanylyltransferase [Methylococcaceae bacterium]
MHILILGGARSGKSRYAENLGLESGLETVYIATAWAGDEEMAERIALHRERRPTNWATVEEPFALAGALQAHAGPHRCLIVDCLTLWLSNLLENGEESFRRERAALLEILPRLPGLLCLVSNEVGLGVVPINPLARRFVDEAGWLHQDLAGICQRVVWIAAGLPQILKDVQ